MKSYFEPGPEEPLSWLVADYKLQLASRQLIGSTYSK